LSPNVLNDFFHAKPPGKALFTTNCMAAAGAPPGRYSLGGIILEMGIDRAVRQLGQWHFSGSALCPDEGLYNVHQWLGFYLENARTLFSTYIAIRFDITLPDLPCNINDFLESTHR
jgi:N-acetylglucosamine-6-phosphate deacetylase